MLLHLIIRINYILDFYSNQRDDSVDVNLLVNTLLVEIDSWEKNISYNRYLQPIYFQLHSECKPIKIKSFVFKTLHPWGVSVLRDR